MNRQCTTLFLLVAMVFSSRLIADEATGITVHPHMGGTEFSNDTGLNDDLHTGIGIGYQFDSPWALELVLQRNSPRMDEVREDAKVNSWRVDGIYHFNTNRFIWNEDLRPYLSIGMGRVIYDFKQDNPPGTRRENKETQFNLGAGFKLDFGPNTSLRTDFRFFHGNRDDRMSRSASLGLHHVFAKRLAVVLPDAPEPEPDSGIAQDPCAGDERAGIDQDDCYVTRRLPVRISLDSKFNFDSSTVRQKSASQISAVAEFMKEYSTTTARLEGHTDSKGTEEYNLALSLRRAKAVADMLIERFGIAAPRLTTKGLGESQPIDTNETEAGRQNNRRVVTLIEAEKEVIKAR